MESISPDALLCILHLSKKIENLYHTSYNIKYLFSINRPVRVNMDLSTSMKKTEKRFPMVARYRAGCDSNGKMQVQYLIKVQCRAQHLLSL